MGKVVSLIKITGTIGDLNFYERKGVLIVRTAGGGFNGQTIKTSPKMQRVRENGYEFRDCVKSVKEFKKGLIPMLHYVRHGEMHQRLVSLFTKLKDADTFSGRGQRSVGIGLTSDAGKKLMMGYSFNPGPGFESIVRQKHSFEWSDRGLHFDDFDGRLVKFPAGATHLELEAGFYTFDFETFTYSMKRSEPILLTALSRGSVQVAPILLTESSGIRVGVVLYRFYQEQNGLMYELKNQESCGLDVVFVG